MDITLSICNYTQIKIDAFTKRKWTNGRPSISENEGTVKSQKVILFTEIDTLRECVSGIFTRSFLKYSYQDTILGEVGLNFDS